MVLTLHDGCIVKSCMESSHLERYIQLIYEAETIACDEPRALEPISGPLYFTQRIRVLSLVQNFRNQNRTDIFVVMK